MIQKTLLFLFIQLSLLSGTIGWAGLPEDFAALQNSGVYLEPTGAICESVALLRFSEMYPSPKYQVITGIEYSDAEGTLGELDLVVFNSETKIAEIIGEVKCWGSPKSGLKKAKEQRARFIRNVKSPKALKFSWVSDRSLKLMKTQFNKARRFISIAQKGSAEHGFDFELPYTLSELMQLREDLLRCQDLGSCKKP